MCKKDGMTSEEMYIAVFALLLRSCHVLTLKLILFKHSLNLLTLDSKLKNKMLQFLLLNYGWHPYW